MRTMKQLREIVAEVFNVIKKRDLTLEETFYLLEMIRFLGIYGKFQTMLMKEIKKLADS